MGSLATPVKTEAISADNRPLELVRDVLKADFDRPIYMDVLPADRQWQETTGGVYIKDPGHVVANGMSLDRFRFFALATAASETCNFLGYLWPVPQAYQDLSDKTTAVERGLSIGQPWFNIAVEFNGSVHLETHPVTRKPTTFGAGERWYEASDITLTKVVHADLVKKLSDVAQDGAATVMTLTITATGGTMSFNYRDQPTADVAYNASATTIRDAIIAVINTYYPSHTINTSDLTVTGTGPFTITFAGDLANAFHGLTVNTGALTGGSATMAYTTRGSGGSQQISVDYMGDSLLAIEPNTGSSNLSRIAIARRRVM